MPSEYELKPCTVAGCDGQLVYSERVVSPRPALAPREWAPLARPRPVWICSRNAAHVEYDAAL